MGGRHRGSRLVVISRDRLIVPQSVKSLDDIINLTIHVAQAMGYTLQELRERVRDRLKSASPDHILVIERDKGLREILCDEIRERDAISSAGLFAGGSGVESRPRDRSHGGCSASIPSEEPTNCFPKDRPVIAVTFNKADDHIRRIRELRQPSTIAVVSASPRFLEVARGILASGHRDTSPAAGSAAAWRQVHLPPRAADLVFCDSIAKRSLRHSDGWSITRSSRPNPWRR